MFLKEIKEIRNESAFLVSAAFEDENLAQSLIKKEGVLTLYQNEREGRLFLGKKEKLTRQKLIKLMSPLFSSTTHEYQIDLKSFSVPAVKIEDLVYDITIAFHYARAELFSAKTKKEDEIKKDFSLLLKDPSASVLKSFERALVHSQSQTFVRQMQFLPPNIANSEYLAEAYTKFSNEVADLRNEILDKSAIEKLNMNLLLAVNAGSVYEPRLVVIEYNGDPNSEEKVALVGKGITFDSGGYNVKPNMRNMKYDMSGSAIAVAAIVGAAKLKAKKNIVVVAPLTDNRISGDANLPDNVIVSMSGKSVEITHTDAEGRLILADAITYAQRIKKAQTVIDIATLTGAISRTLGFTYVGTWSTDNEEFKKVQNASFKVLENVWQMPFDKAFLADQTKSKVADIVNDDYTNKAGSNTAAMFVNFFIEKNVKHLHFDIAGTAKKDGDFTGVLTRTLIEYLGL